MPNEVAECCRMFEEIERERLELVRELGEWPVERQNFRPAEGAWSAVEVVDHVVGSEAATIADVRLGLRNPQVLGEEERPGLAVLERALRSERSFKVPAGGVHPDRQRSLSEVASLWEEERSELRVVVEGLTPEEAGNGVFRHPFAGWMTVEEVLKHFSDHLYHHQFQLARLRMSWAERMEQE
jgi:hypothetical protein